MSTIDRSYALLLIDLWDQHWCKGATKRVKELAPVVNKVIIQARDKGALIIHAPSDTMKYYEKIDSKARQRAIDAPLKQPPFSLTWRRQRDVLIEVDYLNIFTGGPSLPSEIDLFRAGLPIDDSNGGCDDTPRCGGGSPWTCQNEAIRIDEDKDAVSDNMQEIYNLFKQKNIKNVIVMGMHANMCIFWTRDFSIATLLALKKAGHLTQIEFMSDLTDTMYDHRQAPQIDHFAGTDLVVKCIKDAWCPTMLSSDILGGNPFRFKDDQRPLHTDWLKNTVVVKCLGADGNRNWLKADTNSRVSLVQDTSQATAWSLEKIGPSFYSFKAPGLTNPCLDGDPDTGKVSLKDNNTSHTGTRWYVEQVLNAGNLHTLKCCGRKGNRRYLDGDPDNRDVSMHTDASSSGTRWEIHII